MLNWWNKIRFLVLALICLPALTVPSYGQSTPVVRRLLVVRVNFSNATVPCDRAWVARIVWNDDLNVNGFYQTNSFGKFEFSHDVDLDGNDDVFDVTLTEAAATTCNWTLLNHWKDLALADLTSHGVNVSVYQHKLFLLPNEIPCGPGHSEIGCGEDCHSYLRYCSYPDLYIHELAHTLGLNHARTDNNNDGTAETEYGDYSDPMGYSGIGYRHFDAVHKRDLNWITESGEVTADSTNSYDILTTESNPSSADSTRGAIQLIKVAIPDTPGSFYYISYRTKLDAYSEKLSDPDRVHLHRSVQDSKYSDLITTIGIGEQYYDEKGMRVAVQNIDSHYATVKVIIGADAATPYIAPTPTPTPTETTIQTPTQKVITTFKLSGTEISPRSIQVKIRRTNKSRITTLKFDRTYQSVRVLERGTYRATIMGSKLRLLTKTFTVEGANSMDLELQVESRRR